MGLGLGVLLATELLGVKSGGGGGGGAGIVLFFLREPAASSSLDSLEPYPVREVYYKSVFFQCLFFTCETLKQHFWTMILFLESKLVYKIKENEKNTIVYEN